MLLAIIAGRNKYKQNREYLLKCIFYFFPPAFEHSNNGIFNIFNSQMISYVWKPVAQLYISQPIYEESFTLNTYEQYNTKWVLIFKLCIQFYV